MARTKTVYKGKLLKLEVKTVRIGGKLARVESVIERDIVVVLPMLDGNTMLLERQYRPILEKYIYELPAGHMDRRETPRQAAIREMREETGFTPKHLQLMFRAHSNPGNSATISNYFLATGLYKGKEELQKDPDEVISLKKMSIAKVLRMIKSNQIRDTKTIAAVLYHKAFNGSRIHKAHGTKGF